MTIALIGQQVITRYLGAETEITTAGVAAILVINILVSSALHLILMYHGDLMTQLQVKTSMQSDILDHQSEGVVILDPSKTNIIYSNRAARRHLTSRPRLSSGEPRPKVPDWSMMTFEQIDVEPNSHSSQHKRNAANANDELTGQRTGEVKKNEESRPQIEAGKVYKLNT